MVRDFACNEKSADETGFFELVTTLPDIFYIFSDRRGGMYWSPSVEKVLGYSVDQLHAKKMLWNKSIHPDDMVAVTRFITPDKLGKPLIAEYRIRDSAGKWKCLYDRSIAVRTNDGETIVKGLATDITLRKTAERNMGEKSALLEQVIREKDMLFSIIAHDLRSPFSGLLALLRMMRDEYGTIPSEERQAILGSMSDSAERIYMLLENLLSWARLQRGQIVFNPQLSNLLQLTRERPLAAPLHRAAQKQITVSFDIPEDLRVHADQPMLLTILRNLLCNAVKFTHPGGHIQVTARISANNESIISIRDTGVGMSRNALDKLFALRSAQEGVGTSGERGTGLGLMLCHELVSRHGGRIQVESTPGEGTTFHILIPGPSCPGPA